MKQQRVCPPKRITPNWLNNEGMCIVCREVGGLIGIHDILQIEGEELQSDSISQLIYKTFHIEIIDQYKCAELCLGCLNRLREADLFRRQMEATNDAMSEVVSDEQTTMENSETKPKRSIFYGVRKKESTLPPKLDKNAKECPVCMEKAVDYFHLRAHYMRHYLNSICEICGRGFYHKKSLFAHMAQHTEKKVKCQFCNKDYATKLTLYQHVRTVHNKVKMYRCKRCPLSFSASTTRMKHMNDAHNVSCRMYECQECNQAFYTIQRRDLHVKRKHLQVKDHECEWCDFSAPSMGEIINHRTKHSVEKTLSCEQCGKLFKTLRSLKKHINTHEAIVSQLEDQTLHNDILELGDTIHIDNIDTISFVTL